MNVQILYLTWQKLEMTDEDKSVEMFVFGKEKSSVSQGHYNSPCFNQSCGVFMSDGLFCWTEFLGQSLGSQWTTSQTNVEYLMQDKCLCVSVWRYK